MDTRKDVCQVQEEKVTMAKRIQSLEQELRFVKKSVEPGMKERDDLTKKLFDVNEDLSSQSIVRSLTDFADSDDDLFTSTPNKKCKLDDTQEDLLA